jgi:hypothetical protein
MKRIAITLWVLVALGAMTIVWWQTYGSWRNAGSALWERDAVRFGPAPMSFTFVWFVVLLIALLVTWLSRMAARDTRGSIGE